MDLDVIVDQQLHGDPARLHPQPVPNRFFDDELPFGSDFVWHSLTLAKSCHLNAKIRSFMLEEIKATLSEIEAQEDVTVLYACESGSRAWGFPSEDSDYDVRFIYLRPRDWYLSVDLERKRDVVERPISDELDISGWDFRKALHLFYKSSPVLLEWLGSPIVYLEAYATASTLRELAKTYYSAKACMYHYLNMAKNNYRDSLSGETVKTKKYFYVLRPLLAVNWLERGLGVVPTEFEKLVEAILEDKQLVDDINDLIEQKKLGTELGRGPRVSSISGYIDSELTRLSDKKFGAYVQKPEMEVLSSLFRQTLDEVWG